ncbi:hypothetical protein DYQ86_26450 [Acidobacteria bacterium AB60]|nr:hypothetical protein DYQ86_26450 [Acidobacteria bacterium AB60]
MDATAVGEWLRIVLGPVILIFLGVLLFLLVSELIRLSREEDFPRFESNWGGLGRGLGGWSVNRTMVIGLLALGTLLLFGSVSYLVVSRAASPAAAEGAKKSEGTPDSAKPPDTKSPEAKSPEAKAAPAKDSAAGSSEPAAPKGKE